MSSYTPSKDMTEVPKVTNGSRDPNHAIWGNVFIPTRIQNFTTLSLAVPDKWRKIQNVGSLKVSAMHISFLGVSYIYGRILL